MFDLITTKLALKEMYKEDGPERGGFVTEFMIYEVQNICNEPERGFIPSAKDVIDYVEGRNALATWHTHPNDVAELSGEDKLACKVWSNLFHFIVGKDGVRCFKYDKETGSVLEI